MGLCMLLVIEMVFIVNYKGNYALDSRQALMSVIKYPRTTSD